MTDLKNSPLKYFISLENRARYKLIKRYNKPLSYHDVKIINDILYNEKTHYVEQFKEYLIYEDYNEFLKRFYRTFEINIKLPKILIFYEKYSKIYANYTVIPESKYMYKNIKRKQKMIDQMQNNGNNYSEYEEEDEDSNEEISNTVFSSRVINSIYSKTITTLNKSDNDGNTEQSINDFLGKINIIENKINCCLKNNFIKQENKTQKELLPNKKLQKEFLINKTKTSSKITKNIDNKFNNNEQKNKVLDIQFTQSKKVLPNPNDIINNNQNNNSKSNINNNANNKNNYTNLIFINSYASKSKNNGSIFNNNNSIGNNSNIYNNNNTFNGHKNSLNSNTSFPKQKIPTALLKQNIINSSNNINNYKENMSLTNINNYFTNFNNINNEQKYKLSLGENLLKLDKIVLPTNSSSSPKIMNENLFAPHSNKINFFQNKKKQNIKDKDNEKPKKESKNKKGQVLSSNKAINTKKIKSHLLGTHNYNSFGNNLTFLSNKFMENNKLKNISNKLNKKKSKKKTNEKQKEKQNNNNNYKNKEKNLLNEEQISNIHKKPESHRNYCHSKMLSGNNSNTKNKINNNNTNNSNKNFKITVGLKPTTKHSSQKIISTPCSPSSSSTNFYFQSHVNSRKNSINNLDNVKKTLNDNKKKKVVNNFNIVNNIHDNSTQINIYTGNNLYKSLHFQNNSVFNSSNVSPGNTSSKSPMAQGGGNIKNKKNVGQGNLKSNNTTYFNSQIKGKDKQIKYNLDLKKIINKQNIEGEKAIISARQITNRKLFEKLGKYFFKNKNEKNNNYNSNKNINIKNNSKNNSKNNNNNIKNKNNYNDYNIMINKNINKNYNSNKAIKNKTNNNTPVKSKYTPYISKNHRKVPNICLSPQDNEQLNQMNKVSSRQNINYNNIISNLNDLKNIGVDEGAKLLIHSERNKISKIVFK